MSRVFPQLFSDTSNKNVDKKNSTSIVNYRSEANLEYTTKEKVYKKGNSARTLTVIPTPSVSLDHEKHTFINDNQLSVLQTEGNSPVKRPILAPSIPTPTNPRRSLKIQYPKQNPSLTEATAEPTCRICLLSYSDEPSLGEIINICSCKGSIAYLHYSCLKDTLEKKYGKTANPRQQHQASENRSEKKLRTPGRKLHKCEICESSYEVIWEKNLAWRPSKQICEKEQRTAFFFGLTLLSFLGFLLSFSLIMNSMSSQGNSGNSMGSIFLMLMMAFGGLISLIFLYFIGQKLFFVHTFLVSSIKKISPEEQEKVHQLEQQKKLELQQQQLQEQQQKLEEQHHDIEQQQPVQQGNQEQQEQHEPHDQQEQEQLPEEELAQHLSDQQEQQV